MSIRGYTTEINIPSEPLADATNTGEEEPRIKEEGNSAKKMYAKTKSSTPKRKKNRTPKSERTSSDCLPCFWCYGFGLFKNYHEFPHFDVDEQIYVLGP